jgi:hypothetical protein
MHYCRLDREVTQIVAFVERGGNCPVVASRVLRLTVILVVVTVVEWTRIHRVVPWRACIPVPMNIIPSLGVFLPLGPPGLSLREGKDRPLFFKLTKEDEQAGDDSLRHVCIVHGTRPGTIQAF